MAPRTRSGEQQTPASAPAARVYRSTRPAQQRRFPARNKAIKTYGRRSSARSLRQQTLTQIDYLKPLDLAELELDFEDGDRPQKRRKTMGDAPSSSFHTQTLTQFMSGEVEDDDDGGQIQDSQEEDTTSALGDELMAQTPSKQNKRIESRATSIVPQTPAHKRIRAEVPSSQPSPFTPLLDRYSPLAPRRSPLAEKSTNIDGAIPTAASVPKRPRSLVIQDSYTTVGSSLGSDILRSPIARTPLRELRSSQRQPRLNKAHTDGSMDVRSTPPSFAEIPDSDDESGSLGPTPQKLASIGSEPAAEDNEPGTPTPLPKRNKSISLAHKDVPETPVLAKQRAKSPSQADVLPATSEISTPSPRNSMAQVILSTSPNIEETPLSSPYKPSAKKRASKKATPVKSQFYSQALESQRVPLEIIRTMGPQTDRSDIIISIHPEHVNNIVEGTKNHEFRSYRIPHTVTRFWIYVTSPVCELQYMATVGEAKEPGQIDNKGLGNAEFNEGQKPAKFAYELEQVYELNNPVSLAMMKKNGWVETAPQRYNYIPPAVVGQLLANLRCALFADGPLEGGADLSISQEVEQQLRSDIAHTQLLSSDDNQFLVPSSQEPASREAGTGSKLGVTLVQPPFPSGTSPPSLPELEQPSRYDSNFVRPSQATTASEPSSPAPSPEKSVLRPQLPSSVSTFPDFANDSPTEMRSAPFSMNSSQVLLPASLYEDVRQAPVILDSEDEGDD